MRQAKFKPKYRVSEHDSQVAFISYCRQMARIDPRYGLIWANTNAGKRSVGALKYYIAEGLESGVPDITVACPSGVFPGMFIEMKTEKGKPTDKQKQWLSKLHGAGYRVVICRSTAEAIRELTFYFENGNQRGKDNEE